MSHIHSTAVVDPGAKVGDFTSVWHFCHIESRAVVRENCNLGQNVYFGNEAVVGKGCRLVKFVSIFSHVAFSDFVFCAPFMVFARISFPRAAVNRRATFDKTLVEVGAPLGANSTVVPEMTVASGTFLAEGSALTRDRKAWSFMIGSPSHQVGCVSAFGEKIPLPLEGDGQWCCTQTSEEYWLDGTFTLLFPGAHDILKYVPGKKLERVQYTGVTAELPTDHDLMLTVGLYDD